MGNNKNFTLRFNSAISTVTLPYYIQSVSKLRIRTLSYITANAGQRTMLIKINGWTGQNWYFDGVKLMDYTKLVTLIHKTDSLIAYENTNNDVWDIVKDAAVSNLNSFSVEVLIDGVYSSDITQSNPLYLEIVLE